MSLINEALKKAQREREGSYSPAVFVPLVGDNALAGNPAASRVSKAIGGIVQLIVVASVAVAATVVVVVVLGQGKGGSEAKEVSVAVAAPVSAAEAASDASLKGVPLALPARPPAVARPIIREMEALPPASPPAQVLPPPSIQPPVVALTVAAPSVLQEVSAPEKAEPVSVVAVPAPVDQPKPRIETAPAVPLPQPAAVQTVQTGIPVPPPEKQPLPLSNLSIPPNPLALTFLETAVITGIKLSGQKSRVLMNNQVFKLGSIVNQELQIRITKILEDEVYFVDAAGAEYRKQFRP